MTRQGRHRTGLCYSTSPIVGDWQHIRSLAALHVLRTTTAGHALQVLDDYLAIHGDRWRQVTEDNADAVALLEPALAKYQARTHARTHVP